MISEQLLARRKLNLGCGHDIRPDFINVDLHARHGPDLVADITDLSALPSGKFDEIVAQDVLEHLERAKTQSTLNEWARLLRNDGLLHIRVPSIVHMALALCEPANRTPERADAIMHQIFGTQAYDGDYHLAGFTPVLLDALLKNAGLLVCRASILHGVVWDIAARKCQALDDPEDIVHHLYFTLLDRSADEEGVVHFAEMMRVGRMTAADVDAEIRDSEEYRDLQQKPMFVRWHS